MIRYDAGGLRRSAGAITHVTMDFMSATYPHILGRAGLSAPGFAAAEEAGHGLVISCVAGDEWDRIVSRFDGVCQEQLYTYARHRWPQVELEPMLFMRHGKPVGGALVMLQRLPFGLATIAMVKWGPILADDDMPERNQTMTNMVELMLQTYSKRKKFMLSVMPQVSVQEQNADLSMLVSKGFVPGYGIRHPMRYLVDVTLDDDARMAAFHPKWRYNLRKSLKAGLEFQHARTDELGRFMDLYRAMSDRKKFPDYSAVSSLDALMAMPEGTARPELFFVTHQGQTIAGAVIFTAGNTATYLYGATNDAALRLRAGYFLHWHVIRWLRGNTRARLYDLGGTDGFQGLHQFKSGMVGEAGFIRPLPPIANHAASAKARILGNLAYEGREVISRLRAAILESSLAITRRVRRAPRS